MTEAEGDAQDRAAPPEPLFKLQFNANGGLFAPTSVAEAAAWIGKEVAAWEWVRNTPTGGHRLTLDQGLHHLRQAGSHVSQIAVNAVNGVPRAADVQNTVNALVAAYTESKLPHSTTTLGRRIEQVRGIAGSNAAAAYAGLRLSPPDVNFDVRDSGSLFGHQLAMRDQFEPNLSDLALEAARTGYEELRQSVQAFLGEEREALGVLQRQHEQIVNSIQAEKLKHHDEFDNAQAQRDRENAGATKEYSDALERLRRTFAEELSLRAPATYWRGRMWRHAIAAGVAGAVSLAAMLVIAWALGTNELRLSHPLTSDGKPDPWRLGELLLAGVFVVWFMRLIVRIFLSQLHLSQDAAERTTMVTTYLSLKEGGQVTDKDREIILQALFRPGTDGIVKDEGLPPSIAEYFTRAAKP